MKENLKNENQKTKKISSIVLALVVVAVIVATVIGITAYLTDVQTEKNIFTVGNVKIRIDEGAWAQTVENGENLNITPNTELAKQPKIINEGKNDAYVYFKVKIPTGKLAPNAVSESPLFKYTVNNGWAELNSTVNSEEHYVERVYYYTINNGILNGKVGNVEDETTTLFDSVIFENIKGNLLQDTVQMIEVTAYGIQTNGLGANGASASENAQTAYDKYIAEQEELSYASLYSACSTANYGDFVDIGTNILDSNSTSKDWQIYYKDTENNQVYLILADYLPNSTGSAANVGIPNIVGTYNMGDSNGSSDFIEKLNSDLWKSELVPEDLLTKYSGEIDAKGSVDAATFVKSWNDLYSTGQLNINRFDSSTFETSADGVNNALYYQHSGEQDGCPGYWISTVASNASLVYMTDMEEKVVMSMSPNYPGFGIRPIVILSDKVNAKHQGNLWIVK